MYRESRLPCRVLLRRDPPPKVVVCDVCVPGRRWRSSRVNPRVLEAKWARLVSTWVRRRKTDRLAVSLRAEEFRRVLFVCRESGNLFGGFERIWLAVWNWVAFETSGQVSERMTDASFGKLLEIDVIVVVSLIKRNS